MGYSNIPKKWNALTDEQKNKIIHTKILGHKFGIDMTMNKINYLSWDGFEQVINILNNEQEPWDLHRGYYPTGCYDFFLTEWCCTAKSLGEDINKFHTVCADAPWDALMDVYCKFKDIKLED